MIERAPFSSLLSAPSSADKHHAVAANLARQGWAVCEDFFAVELIAALRAELEGLRRDGGVRRAAIGRGEDAQVHDAIRGDHIAWLQGGGATAAQRAFLQEMETLRLVLNEGLFLGLFEYEGHLAFYPPGAFYRRHLDRHRGSESRIVSCVAYLNAAWQPGEGGELRLFLDEGRVVDIEPRGGTLVCFLSGELEHEVLSTRVPRYSVAGWLRRRDG